jgi:hypothetical protein
LGGAREDLRLRAREGAQMRLEHLDGLTPIVLVLIALGVAVPLAAFLFLLAAGGAHFE